MFQCKRYNYAGAWRQARSGNFDYDVIDIKTDLIRDSEWGSVLEALYSSKKLHYLSISCPPRQMVLESRVEERFQRRLSHFLACAIQDCLDNNTILSALKLTRLDFCHSDIRRLSKSFATTQNLSHLCLQGVLKGLKDFSVVTEGLKNVMSLKELHFMECHLDVECVKELVKLMQHQSYTRHGQAWQDSLRYRRVEVQGGLQVLNLHGNPSLSDLGVSLLLDELIDDASITTLNLSRCGLGNSSGLMVLHLCTINPRIVCSLASNDDIDASVMMAIVAAYGSVRDQRRKGRTRDEDEEQEDEDDEDAKKEEEEEEEEEEQKEKEEKEERRKLDGWGNVEKEEEEVDESWRRIFIRGRNNNSSNNNSRMLLRTFPSHFTVYKSNFNTHKNPLQEDFCGKKNNNFVGTTKRMPNNNKKSHNNNKTSHNNNKTSHNSNKTSHNKIISKNNKNSYCNKFHTNNSNTPTTYRPPNSTTIVTLTRRKTPSPKVIYEISRIEYRLSSKTSATTTPATTTKANAKTSSFKQKTSETKGNYHNRKRKNQKQQQQQNQKKQQQLPQQQQQRQQHFTPKRSAPATIPTTSNFLFLPSRRNCEGKDDDDKKWKKGEDEDEKEYKGNEKEEESEGKEGKKKEEEEEEKEEEEEIDSDDEAVERLMKYAEGLLEKFTTFLEHMKKSKW